MTSPHGQTEMLDLEAYCNRCHHHQDGERFGRMWGDAPPLFTDPTVLERLGRQGGPMEDTENAKSRTIPAGFVFFGQFVDHDITLDLFSSLSSVNVPDGIVNSRTPTLDLDCVYGLGSEAHPYLYAAEGPFKGVKLITGADAPGNHHKAQDLPRMNGIAMIGDFRNDENRVVSQIQLGMIRFHNKMAEQIAGEYGSGQEKEHFAAARKLTTWHYQWAVVNDFLKKICGAPVVERILSEGRQHYRPHVPFIPVEFSVAAFRFGHSMVPMQVRTQSGGEAFDLFGDVLGRGFTAIRDGRAVVDMRMIFATEGFDLQPAGRMDAKLAGSLLHLPIPVDALQRSLATRNMVRGQSFLLPSGETVARRIGRPETEIAQIRAAAAAAEPGLVGGTPLWYYILTEAGLIGRATADGGSEPGEGLGPVGATIVAEVICGLIELDQRSWLSSDRSWRPIVDPRTGRPLDTVGAILTYAQEPAPARGAERPAA